MEPTMCYETSANKYNTLGNIRKTIINYIFRSHLINNDSGLELVCFFGVKVVGAVSWLVLRLVLWSRLRGSLYAHVYVSFLTNKVLSSVQ